MELFIRHQTIYRYATPASQVALLLRLHPATLSTQQPQVWQVTVNGVPVTEFQPNPYGDLESFVRLKGGVNAVAIVAEGFMETTERAGVVSGFQDETPLGVYLRRTPLTQPDEAIRALASGIADLEPIARLHALSARVHEALAYTPGGTTQETTAAEALGLGQGVCQDQAHLFVSAARCLGVPARYIAGYLLADGSGHILRETHAWAEAWVEDLGWIGFDPTNRVCVTEQHVRLCAGLDAHDAAPVRGSVLNTTDIAIQADVLIRPKGAAGQQAQQQQ